MTITAQWTNTFIHEILIAQTYVVSLHYIFVMFSSKAQME